MKLGVNVDHIATLRQVRGTLYPVPSAAAAICQNYGADSIVMHLREDRRHINDNDVLTLKNNITVPFNMEMSVNKEIVAIALKIKPYSVTLVPEKRKELTTEGGLDLVRYYKKVNNALKLCKARNIKVSLFIDPIKKAVDIALAMGVYAVEFNTGRYSETKNEKLRKSIIDKLTKVSDYAKQKGLFVAAGHGLDYDNVKGIASIKSIDELNIGHSIICRAVFCGLGNAVSEMKNKINGVTL